MQESWVNQIKSASLILFDLILSVPYELFVRKERTLSP